MSHLKTWTSMSEDRKTALRVEEEALEIEAIEAGIIRYREAMKKMDPASRTPEQRVLCRCMPKLTEGFRSIQKQMLTDMRENRWVGREWWPVVILLDPEKLALISLIAVLACHEKTRAAACSHIGRQVKLELYFEELKETNKELYKRSMEHVKQWDPRKIELIRKKAKIPDLDWAPESIVKLGACLLNAVLSCCDIVEVRQFVQHPNRIDSRLYMTDETIAELSEQHGQLEILTPFLRPMVIPPVRWDRHGRGGGYVFHKDPLVHHLPHEHECDQDSGLVASAINYIQDQEWVINPAVLDASKTIWTNGGGMAKLPYKDGTPIPARPEGHWESPNVVAWRKQAAEIHTENAEEASLRASTVWKISTAEKMAAREAIWFPHFLCFRGRSYPMAAHMNPQGDDLARGLLRFAEEKPITDEGVYDLKVHLANCHGHDKKTFKERVEFSDDYLVTVYGESFDPFEDRRWMDADDPFSALAVHHELHEILRGKRRTTSVPVSIDGTCNGLQHLSALGRDAVGAGATNLIDLGKPQDIYQIIADKVNAAIEKDLLEGDNPMARAWHGKVTRKTVKRATMTTPYGVTRLGMRSQFITDKHVKGLDGKPFQLAAYMEQKTWDALGETVIASRSIMSWFREVAKILGEANQSMRWTTHLGFRVNQKYVVKEFKRVRSALNVLALWVPVKDRRVSVSSQVRGSSPNVIHSFDAAHMMATAIRSEEENICFSATHDSFKTHAGNVRLLGRLLREEFVEMYDQMDLLRALHEEISSSSGLMIPDPPERGSFDVRLVLSAPYCFC